MSIERIDSISGIDPTSINFSNLRWRYGTGMDTSTGNGIYTLTKDSHTVLEYPIPNYLMCLYEVKVPLRIQGWINKSLQAQSTLMAAV